MLTASLLSSCAFVPQAITREPSAPRAWVIAKAEAATAVQAGRYGVADRLLSHFTEQYSGTAEAADASYWRAIYRIDPANLTASARGASTLLDSTLALPLDSAQRSNAMTLRRITAAMERAAALSVGATSSDSTPKSDAKSQDDELQRLKNELAKANAELERIKKRVAQPKP